MRKTYKSKAAKLRLVVEVRGERVGIEFGWDIVSRGGAMGCGYSTDDAAIQEAIERDPLFGNRIWCENNAQCEMHNAQCSSDTPIENIAEARKVLREQYGKSAEETKTKVQVLTLLNELGVGFQF